MNLKKPKSFERIKRLSSKLKKKCLKVLVFIFDQVGKPFLDLKAFYINTNIIILALHLF